MPDASHSSQHSPRFTRRNFLGLLGGLTAFGTARSLVRASVSENVTEVISQKANDSACGPYALSNALNNGDAPARSAFRKLPGATATERAEALTRQYGARPSETYGSSRGRFKPGAGLTCADMPFLANDFLADAGLPKAAGIWLDRRANEDASAHLRRLHGLLTSSLARGFPPVMELRSFAADVAPSAKPNWVNLYAHWVALIGVEPANLPSGASGFLCRFADSFTGRVVTGFAHVELYRPFMATRGFTLKKDGTQDWHWLSGYPYILLEIPDIPLLLQTRPWQNRALVALTYMVHRPAA